MGCDGGTIPTRDELVRVKKKPEQRDKLSVLSFKWKHCTITQEKLRSPIVACQLGRLYNKESVLEFLLDKSKFDQNVPSECEHLKGLKDVKELKLTINPAFKEDSETQKGDNYNDSQTSRYICPVVGVEMNGKYKFSFIWSCGCVISDRALKEVKTDVCHSCGKPFNDDNVVILNGTDEEIEEMQIKMESRKVKAKLEKKLKRSYQQASASRESEFLVSESNGPSTSKQAKSDIKEEKVTKNATATTSSVKSDAKSTIASSKTAFSKKDDKKFNSIQKDPKASNAYKSLFTSSDKAKNQQQPHWITFNPLYY